MTGLSDLDLSNIEKLHDIWIAKELEGNASEVLDLCTDDIQWMPPDAPPIVGKEKIANFLATDPVKLLVVNISNLSIRGSGSVAYLTSNYFTRYLSQSHSEFEHDAKGTHLWVLRKEDNRWRIAVVAWSSW
jgi:ketosteroid isomerase-like protein